MGGGAKCDVSNLIPAQFPEFLCSPVLVESEGGVQRAAARSESAEQQSSTTAGLHVPPSGVGHQHRVLQPLDGPSVSECGPRQIQL